MIPIRILKSAIVTFLLTLTPDVTFPRIPAFSGIFLLMVLTPSTRRGLLISCELVDSDACVGCSCQFSVDLHVSYRLCVMLCHCLQSIVFYASGIVYLVSGM